MTDSDTPTERFRDSLHGDDIAFLLEAHDGVSAKIVDEAGFDGIWASSLAMSASLGVRDANEMSSSEVLRTVGYMSDIASTPIVVDADTGYGDFNNFRLFVAKLEQLGASAVCVEDKTFPKTNSFVDGEGNQQLATIEDFSAKIRAAKDILEDDAFTVIARTEAFIAGEGLAVALERATAYHQAGADAIFIHSKKETADEVWEFIDEWNGRSPVVVVPTSYYMTPTDEFREAGVSAVIWANHTVRAAIKAMQHVADRIRAEESVIGVETDDVIVPVDEILRLQDVEELEQAKEHYLRSERGE